MVEPTLFYYVLILSYIILNAYVKETPVIQLSGVYVNPIQNNSLLKLNDWFSFTGHQSYGRILHELF